MDTINCTCYPRCVRSYPFTDTVKGRVEVVLITLAGRLSWLPLAICLSMGTLLLTGCGSEAPATDTPVTGQISTPAAPATATEAQQPTAAPAPTSPPAEMAVETGHKVGQKAPDFMLTTVDGEQVSLDGFQGRPLVIYFYATW